MLKYNFIHHHAEIRLVPTQPPIHWKLGVLFQFKKHEANHLYYTSTNF
jgi:hypothetical protein